MDFFQAQDRARVRSRRLVAYFGLAVLGIVLAVNALVWVAMEALQGGELGMAEPFWEPGRLLVVGLAVGAVIGLSSLIRVAQLSQGGGAVARSLGGRRVDLSTSKVEERRLVNVVEEMALAAGTPMPEIYILDEEMGINAFAAGHTVDDAAVAVTRGTLNQLTRDELQGVIAHEFSHIVNGDMRLNIRLAGILFGILVIGILGRMVFEGMVRGVRFSGSSRGGGKGGGGAVVVVALALGLMLIGYIGTLFGRLIQAAVSRQREFLADAAAVQFTRNPGGIAGALKKIGGIAERGKVSHAQSSGLAHLFFASALGGGWAGFFATHPPLETRIRAIDPDFDRSSAAPRAQERERRRRAPDATAGFSGQGSGVGKGDAAGVATRPAPLVSPIPAPSGSVGHPAAVSGAIPLTVDELIGRAGQVENRSVEFVRAVLSDLPPALRAALRDPVQATAVIPGLLLSQDLDVRARQFALLRERAPAEVMSALGSLQPVLTSRPPRQRLPILELAIAVVRDSSPWEPTFYYQTLIALARADRKQCAFETALLRIVRNRLAIPGPVGSGHRGIPLLEARREVLLSLAVAGGANNPSALVSQVLANHGFGALPGGAVNPDPDFVRFEQALERLAEEDPDSHQPFLHACAEMVVHDGAIGVEEAELFRAIALGLRIPVPPVIATRS